MSEIPWPACMNVATPANAAALDDAMQWVCITCPMAPPVPEKHESFMNALRPGLTVSFGEKVEMVQAVIDKSGRMARHEFLSMYLGQLVTR